MTKNATETTIIPDERMQAMADCAIQVQDACNGVAVSSLLHRTMCSLLKYDHGTDWVNQHPITKAILNKLEDLAGMPQANDIKDFHACMDLAEGIAVTVDIS